VSDATIHPTAIVDPRASLGARVRVGPYSVIGPNARLGEDVDIGHRVTIEGAVELGPGVSIGHGTILGGAPQDLKYHPDTPTGVRVGPRTSIREYVTVHRGSSAAHWTEIGADCLIMAMAHVAHDCRLGDGVIVINYAGITGHCEIGDRATIGGLTGMVPFSRIGALAYVGGMAKVTADVPPYMMVDGQPATVRAVNLVGLRRAGVPPADRRLIQEAYRILYRSALAPKRALERLREELPAAPVITELVAFIAASRHGICGPPRAADEAEDATVDAQGEG